MVQYRIIYRDKQLLDPTGPPSTLEQVQKILKDEKRAVWIDILEPMEADVQAIADVFPMHPVTIEDLTVITREKLEVFRDYRFITINELENHQPHQLKIVWRQEADIVLTFRREGMGCLGQVIQRLRKNTTDIKYDPIWIAYGLIDEIGNIFIQVVQSMVAEVHHLDELILSIEQCRADQQILERLAAVRKQVATLRTSLWAKQEILQQMLKLTPTTGFGNHPLSSGEDQLQAYLRDVVDHVIRMQDKLVFSTDQLNHLGNIYLTRVSLEMGRHSEEMNQTINRFSAVATIFLPLSVLTGLWGMNVRVPGQLSANNQSDIPFYSITGVVVLLALLISGYFRYRRWI